MSHSNDEIDETDETASSTVARGNDNATLAYNVGSESELGARLWQRIRSLKMCVFSAAILIVTLIQ